MTIATGARLGPYEVVSPLGAGGMGEVYRARDTRLGREVALKVLPEAYAVHPASPSGGDASPAAVRDDRRARFEQEARAASALNHPNIVTVFDVGEHAGVPWLAMELIEGRTLRDVLVAGGLPTRKVLDVAAQLADGLAKAHAAGISHRDLKPENVMVSKDGFVKILDFGLAKLVQGSAAAVSDLVTLPGPATTPGAVLGTVGYMSPEQASGREVDYRSDQFSLGTILYEMVAGAPPFKRPTHAETMAAIIREQPDDLAVVSPRAPAPLRWILDRLLAKDPDDRFASTHDLARDLATLRDRLSEASTSTRVDAVAARPRRRWLLPVAAAAGCLAVGAAAGAWIARSGGTTSEITAQRLTYRRGAVLTARFTPDGQSVVYSASWDGGPIEAFQVRLDSPESRPLGFGAADVLAVSATGELALALNRRFVFGWEAPGTLARVPLGGGAPREVLEAVQAADWLPDGSLVVARDVGRRRQLEFPAGTMVFDTAGWISNPRVSPDGQRVAFLHHSTRGDNQGEIMVIDRGGAARLIGSQASNGIAWSPDGREIWAARGVALDLEGRRRQLFLALGLSSLHDVARDGRVLMSRAAWRRELVGRMAGQAAESNLTWLDWSYPEELSADGRLLLFDEQNLGDGEGNYSVYLRRAGEPLPVLLGHGHSFDLSPDGRWALVDRRDGGKGLTLLPTGVGEPRQLPKHDWTVQAAMFFPDGARVLVLAAEPGRGNRLFVTSLSGGSPKPISPEGTTLNRWRAVSPDGQLVVARAPDGALAFYPAAGGDPRPVPGATPEDVPIRWTTDGRGLFVQRGIGVPTWIDVLDVTTGARRSWKELRPPDPAGVLSMGPIRLSADGQSYVYSYRRTEDVLMLIAGVK